MRFFKCAVLSFFFSISSHSQEFDISGQVGGVAILSNADENPFWFHTNTNYAIGELSNISATANLKGSLVFSKFKLHAGAEGFARDGVSEPVQRGDLYLQFENKWLLATVGAKKQREVLDGLSATNQNFLWSGNARPLPGILLEANNPIKISKTFALDWAVAHYELNDNRFVDGTHLHYKHLALITRFNENHKLTAKLQHYAQWGGTSPVFGPLKDSFKDFVNVFFAHNDAEIGFEGETINKVGNHLGSYFLNYEFTNRWGSFAIYHDHPFEDGSGTRLANFPDGVWGAYFRPNNRKIISSVLYEFIDTSDQSGISAGSGFDGYFGNNIYRSGWTYEKNIIGAPVILFVKDLKITGENTPYINNRTKVHHVGIFGELGNFHWKLKSTLMKYMGTYRKPFYPEWKYWYNYGAVSYKNKSLGTFSIMAGIDASNVAKTVFGAGAGYSYSF
jgi:hypothetical protein